MLRYDGSIFLLFEVFVELVCDGGIYVYILLNRTGPRTDRRGIPDFIGWFPGAPISVRTLKARLVINDDSKRLIRP